jgi:hypothetical protein
MVSNGEYGNSGDPGCSPKGVCDIKPINGKILQTAFWESDQFVVLLKQGNSCGGKELTEVRVTLGSHLTHPEVKRR